ncbi:helix-turn-helix domain-containing protein [Nocardia sp. NPDC004722]
MRTFQADRVENWSQVCSAAFVPTRVHADESFRGTIRQRTIADLGLTHVASTPVVVQRDNALIAAGPSDDTFLTIQLAGACKVDQAGRRAEVIANAAVLLDTARPYELRADFPQRHLVLQVPGHRLRGQTSVIRDSTARPIEFGAPALLVLRHVLTGIMREGCPPGSDDQLADTTIELLSAVLDVHCTGHSAQPLSGEVLLHAARTFMQRQMTDPDLDVEAVAAAHGVSRRYLELLFARTGESPAAHLRGLRLDEARRRLRETSATVTDIAHGVGFNDVNTFTRAFRRIHDTTPREWRNSHLADNGSPAAQ